MQQCPKCQKSTKTSERIETDKKAKKSWLITFCARCAYNYEIEQYMEEVLSPTEEMDKYPEITRSHYWNGL